MSEIAENLQTQTEQAIPLYPTESKFPGELSEFERAQINTLLKVQLDDEFGEIEDPIADITDPEIHAAVLFQLARDEKNNIIGCAAFGNAPEVSFLEGDDKHAVMLVSSVAVSARHTGHGVGSSLVFSAITSGPSKLMEKIRSMGDESRIKGLSNGIVVYVDSDSPVVLRAALKGAKAYQGKSQLRSPKAAKACATLTRRHNKVYEHTLVEKYQKDARPATEEELKAYGVDHSVNNRIQTESTTQYRFATAEEATKFREALDANADMSEYKPIKTTELPPKTSVRIAFELKLDEAQKMES